jgi:DNA-binding transcriptional regulator LsrR (DeoR family)
MSPMSPQPDLNQLRMMTKVSHQYHILGMVQSEIAQQLGLSQARVSRLLSAALEANIVRTIVVPPPGLFSELEQHLESEFGLLEVHVVDASGENERDRANTLGRALANVFEIMPFENKNIGFTSWSNSMRAFVDVLNRPHAKAKHIIEMLGGVGQPGEQHLATQATENLANLTEGKAMFLRVPGVVPSVSVRAAILESDTFARSTLEAMNHLDIALVGLGNCEIRSKVMAEGNFFTKKQFDMIRELGAVGEIDLRFIDKNGAPIVSELDDLVIGVTLEQIKKADRRIGVSGGEAKRDAALAAVRGGWINVLITDEETAEYLLVKGPAK